MGIKKAWIYMKFEGNIYLKIFISCGKLIFPVLHLIFLLFLVFTGELENIRFFDPFCGLSYSSSTLNLQYSK
jgi:hypothetical protein